MVTELAYFLCILKTELLQVAEGMEVECEKKNRVKDGGAAAVDLISWKMEFVFPELGE